MTIENPRVLWVLLVVIPMIVLQLRGYLRGRADLNALGRYGATDAAQTLFLVKWFFSSLTFDLFVTFAVFALADVVWGERPVEEDRTNLDVVVALDISRSMLAEDIAPSRLGRSSAVVRSVSRQLPAVRFALVAFKGEAVLLLPLTEDLNALEAVLDGVTPELVSAPGTDLERGISRAVGAFPEGINTNQAILLFTDGESLQGAPGRAATEARVRGIPVYAIIAGTRGGATVSAPDGTVMTDEEGRPVISHAAPGVLEAIAAETGGQAIRLDDLDAVDVVVDNLMEFATTRETAGYRLVSVHRYPLFVLAALVALALSMSVRIIRWRDMF